MDLKAAFKEASDRLEKQKGASGIGSTDSLVDRLGDIKDKASSGDTSVVGQVQAVITEFQECMNQALSDPASLAPGGGCFAGCASWYGSQVSSKLGRVKGEADTLSATFTELADDVSGLMPQLSSALSSAMPVITQQVKELVGLPGEVMKVIENCDMSMESIAKIDLSGIERSLDVSPINQPLDSLTDAKGTIGPVIEKVEAGLQSLNAFAKKAPNQVKKAFDIAPCLPMNTYAPPAMKTMLEKLKMLESLDLTPLITLLSSTNKEMKSFNADMIKNPLNKFSEFAKGETQSLTDKVSTAKQAAQAREFLQSGVAALGKLIDFDRLASTVMRLKDKDAGTT